MSIENKLDIGAKWLRDAAFIAEYVLTDFDNDGQVITAEMHIIEIATRLQDAYNEGQYDKGEKWVD